MTQSSEIEAIFDRKLQDLTAKLQVLRVLTQQSISHQDQECWEALIKNYDKLLDTEKQLGNIIDALQWELQGKRQWEQEHNRKFHPALICGDG
jgi:hypothetical protein